MECWKHRLDTEILLPKEKMILFKTPLYLIFLDFEFFKCSIDKFNRIYVRSVE